MFLRSSALIALLFMTGTVPVLAQVTSEQQSAIRANCRSDFMSKCSGVTPGGKDALMCLQKNVASLSPGCKTAVSATIPKPAAAAPAAPPPAPPPAAVAAPPSPPAAAAPAPATATAGPKTAPSAAPTAAKPPAATISRQAPPPARQPAKPPASAVAATAPTAPPPPAPPPAAAAGPTPQQLTAVKFTCRRDFDRYCKSTPAGLEAFACLQRNSARVSANCKTSLADIEDSMPAAAAAPAAPPPIRAAAAPAAHPVANAVVMLRACKIDLVRHCQGVAPGTESACLSAHENGLTVRCRMARKVSAPLR